MFNAKYNLLKKTDCFCGARNIAKSFLEFDIRPDYTFTNY